MISKRTLKRTWILIVGMGLLCPTPLFAFSSAVFDQKITVEGQTVAEFRMHIKKGKMRAASKAGLFEAVLIRNDEGVFNYLPDRNLAAKMPEQGSPTHLADDLPDYKNYLESNHAVKVGTAVVKGYDCDIYEFKEPISGGASKAWVWQERQFPIKIEVETPQGLTGVEFENVQLDVPIEDSLFEIPDGVQIMEWNQSQIPGSPPPPASQP